MKRVREQGRRRLAAAAVLAAFAGSLCLAQETPPGTPAPPAAAAPVEAPATAAAEAPRAVASGVVTATILVVRARPAAHYERIGQFARGDKVAIVGETADWLQVRVPADTRAWIAAQYLDAQGVVGADQVRLHSGPGLVFTTFAAVPKGTRLDVLGPPVDGWQQVRAPAEAAAWVSRAYVRLETPEPPAAEAAATAATADTTAAATTTDTAAAPPAETTAATEAAPAVAAAAGTATAGQGQDAQVATTAAAAPTEAATTETGTQAVAAETPAPTAPAAAMADTTAAATTTDTAAQPDTAAAGVTAPTTASDSAAPATTTDTSARADATAASADSAAPAATTEAATIAAPTETPTETPTTPAADTAAVQPVVWPTAPSPEAPLVMREGILLSLGSQASEVASHVLSMPVGQTAYPLCYLKSLRIDLTGWENRNVCVYGRELQIPGWQRLVMHVESIQVKLR